MTKHDERIANMTFAEIYPMYISKIERKGRTVDELDEVLSWLTGFSKEDLQNQVKQQSTFKEFFDQANIHPNAQQIKGVICGVRIEEIENELTQKARYMDKLVDELAKGKKMEKIMRN